MVVYVKMNGKIIAEFRGSKITGLTAQQEAKLYLDSVLKAYPEAIVI